MIIMDENERAQYATSHEEAMAYSAKQQAFERKYPTLHVMPMYGTSADYVEHFMASVPSGHEILHPGGFITVKP